MSGTSTRAPSGSAAATSPTSEDTTLPTATVGRLGPTSRANECRARSTADSHVVRAGTGRHATRPAPPAGRAGSGCGGRPYVAVLEHPGSASHRSGSLAHSTRLPPPTDRPRQHVPSTVVRGAVAQLVAHHTGSVGVRGSSPLSSTLVEQGRRTVRPARPGRYARRVGNGVAKAAQRWLLPRMRLSCTSARPGRPFR